MPAIRCCTVYTTVIGAETIDQRWSICSLSGGNEVSTLDEISKEKQRLGEALARVDAQREKLTSQLSELEATERVLVRYSSGARATRTAAKPCRRRYCQA